MVSSPPGIAGVIADSRVEAFCHTGPQLRPTGVDRIDADLSPTALRNRW